VSDLSANAEQRTEEIEAAFHLLGVLPWSGSNLFFSCGMNPVFWVVC
jgi:hypothetical protein